MVQNNIYKWIFPILIVGTLLVFLTGGTGLYLTSHNIGEFLDYMFPPLWEDFSSTVGEWNELILAIPVLNFFYAVIGLPFLYLIIYPFMAVSVFVYRLFNLVVEQGFDFFATIPLNHPDYPFPTSYPDITNVTPVTL